MSPAVRPIDVLLVDDDPIVRKNYGAALRAAGWNVTVAADGDEALRTAWDRKFHVVLLDVRIPVRKGAEVLRALRSRPQSKETDVLLLAQSGDADLVEAAMREGAQGVFEKGRSTPRDVVDAVLERVGARAASAAAARATPTIVDLSTAPRPAAAKPPALRGAARTVTAADSARPVAAPLSAAPMYSVTLSRYVGETARLAAAMRLPADLACPACGVPLALLLAPDSWTRDGVRGRFACPRCVTD